MMSLFRKLWKNKRGNALIVGAAALPMIVACAGLASDTIQWTMWKRQLQRAADSAAIAGVYDRENASPNGSTTNTASAVSHDLTLNMHTWMGLSSGFPQVTFPANSGVMTNQVQVTLQIQQSLPFSSMFMTAAPTITATSTAASIPAGGNACIEALDPNAANAIYFSGNAAVYMPNCDAFSNSAATNSAAAKGSADVTANSVGGVGGIAQSSNFHVTSYRPYSPALSDPFAGVTPDPSQMNCTSAALTQNTNFGTLAAGTNCFSSMSVQSNQTLTIPSSYTGPIYINGGNADIRGNFTCANCTIVLTNQNASTPIGNITVNASTNLNITAPTSGTYKGIAIYQDRRAQDCNNCNKINGNSGSIITGAIYFPSQEVQYNGTGNTTATCTMFVAKRITFTGNSGTSNKFQDLSLCAAAGLPGNVSHRMVRLVG